jgi:NADPH-dependent 2,4-dienoyl-CoA reductase/sulfur reductase-like enzyme
MAGREQRLRDRLNKTDCPKRVTIVGGGPGGMVTAIVANKRGHEVTILEKDAELGGQLNLAVYEDYKLGLRNYTEYLKNQIRLNNINVEFKCDATVDRIRCTNPDVVVVATGADVFIPKIPGSDKENVMTVRTLYEKKLKGNERIAVIGGGLVGCETALGLARNGHEVTIIEMLDSIANGLTMANLHSIIEELGKSKVKIFTGTTCKSIEDKDILCLDKNGKEFNIPYDFVVAATGTKSQKDMVEKVQDAFPDVYVIGDCISPGKIQDAVHQGFYTGIRI